MATIKIEHINMTVLNLENSFAFYQRLFGFKKRWEGMAIGEVGEVRAWHIGTSDFYLALFEAEEQGTAPSNYGVAGVNHIAIEVDDLMPYRTKLAEMNVPIHLEGNYEPGERIYFVDPDGIEIELVKY